MPPPRANIVVLGIDAANPTLLRNWAKSGSLPNIQRLLDRGLTGNTRSIDGFFIGSTWPSFSTGVTPARHGCHYLVQLQPRSYDFYPVADHGIVRHEPFWTRLSRAGRRVCVLDVPLSSLDESLNGIQVVEWGGHDSAYGFQASPSDLKETIEKQFGLYPLGPCCDGLRRSANDYERFLRALTQGVQTKGELTKHFLQQGGWDFFMQVFTESHCVGHQCWHLHDQNHPAHDEAITAKVGDPLHRVYASIDQAIGEILAAAGDALVMLVVAHGMSHWYGANFLLRDILLRLEVARPLDEPAASGSIVTSSINYAKRSWRRLPVNFRRHVSDVRERLHLIAPQDRLPTLSVDPKTSYCLPHNNGMPVSGIRLNVLGREPTGQLPQNSVDTFCNDLTRELLSVVDQRNGKPSVRRVLRTRDLFRGQFLDDLPDLLVEWDDAIPTGSAIVGDGEAATVRVTSPRIGVVEGVNQFGRTGEHRPEGMLIAAGPGLAQGVIERELSILDFAPTFTSLLDVECDDFDGSPMDDVLDSQRNRTAGS